jgi:hypothetical protein
MTPEHDKLHKRLLVTVAAVAEARTQLAIWQKEAGAALKQARKSENTTLDKVAKALGTSLFKVWQAERGTNLTPKLFERYLDAVDAIALNRNVHVRYSARP